MLLRTQKLGIDFGGLKAVDAVDLVIGAGAVTAIIGPNGAGKSTLFNLLNGFHKPTSGRIFFEGDDITGLPSHRIARRGISRTFQTTRLFPTASALENVLIGYRMHTRTNLWDAILRTPRARREEAECRDRAMRVLEFVGIPELAPLPVGSLPQEAQKRVAIALALVSQPKLLLLDEPAAGVNANETAALAELIRYIVSSGTTVCLVEHKMRMVMALADTIIVLNHGQKIAEGPPDQICSDPAVIEAYLGGRRDA
ncbi:MAG: ATP-binding cassette domain-containing protein [Gemmatimonas sp.]|nr:ATP-binding cassette domain-containing protein [Gemmatimonas sp.]